jgi:DNA-directed RNA polymerase specialized sigma24 family protein
MDDAELLRLYARDGSESAFQTLVERYLGLVHSAALRQVCDPHMSEDVAQVVFIILARKAGRLSARANMLGWLYRATRLASMRVVRTEMRRLQREQAAVEVEFAAVEEETACIWEQIAPLLEFERHATRTANSKL